MVWIHRASHMFLTYKQMCAIDTQQVMVICSTGMVSSVHQCPRAGHNSYCAITLLCILVYSGFMYRGLTVL